MKFRVFSRRYERQISNIQTGLSLPSRARQRFWFSLSNHDERMQYHPYPGNNWTENTDVLTEVEGNLLEQHGIADLKALIENDADGEANLYSLVLRGYPVNVFDVIESAYNQMSNEYKISFQTEINSILEEEEIPWRFADGHFFKIDTTILTKDIVIETCGLLKANGFEGALEEYKEARNDFTSGDFKGAIHNSCKSLESVLKVVTGLKTGNASVLIRKLPNSKFYSDLPDSFKRAFGESVLMSLPFLRNNLGGHGQGEEVISISKEYAELAIHMAGSFILFIIQHYLKLSSEQENLETKENSLEDDDLPSIKLPRGYIGWARIPPGKKQSFRLALKKLINDKLVLTFIPYFRALKGFAGGKNIPQLSIWSAKNRDKLSEIAAISLTSNGFNKGKDLANKHKLLFPWQTHKLMIRDKSFVEFLTQQKLQ